MEISRITIGGKEISIPELNFKSLKKIFPIVRGMQIATEEQIAANPELAMAAIEDTIKVVSIALERSESPMTPDEIEEAITQSELPGLQPAMIELMKANGLMVMPGEPVAVAEKA